MRRSGAMEIEYGAEVIDKNGKVLGTVDLVIRNTWTGEVSTFAVRCKGPEKYNFYSTKDVLEATKSKVKVNFPLDKLNELA